MGDTSLGWKAISSEPRFRRLHRRKNAFLFGLWAFALAFYFLLPIGAAYVRDLYGVRIWGALNVGMAFALLQFVVAWGIALYYARRASAEFDPLAAAVVRDAETGPGALR